MKKSIYTINRKVNNSNDVILLNTVTGASMIMSEKLYLNLDSTDDNELINACIKNGFLVDDDYDEQLFVNTVRYANNYNESSMSTFVIIPTTACNARCVYCYENGLNYTYMSKKTAEQTVKFIISSSLGNDIKLMWFGGEPLMAIDTIDFISNRILSSLKAGQKYNSSMISNGSLITDSVIDKMVGVWNCSRVQISLDGFADEYARRKRYTVHVGYDSIIENINRLSSKGIQVAIRLNFDRCNYDEILKLIGHLSDNIEDKKLISVYAIPLFPPSTEKEKGKYFKPEELDDIYERIYNELINAGFIHSVDYFAVGLKSHFCSAMKLQHSVISTSGDLYKCQHINAVCNRPIGDVYKGAKLCYNHGGWINPTMDKKCADCVFLPMCQGGCRASSTEAVFGCCLLKYTVNSTLHAIRLLNERRRK